MNKQPKIRLPVSGGHWEILAHLPSASGLKYSATLHISGETACFVFGYESAYVNVDSHELILDSAYINLGTEHNRELTAHFLAETANHVEVKA